MSACGDSGTPAPDTVPGPDTSPDTDDTTQPDAIEDVDAELDVEDVDAPDLDTPDAPDVDDVDTAHTDDVDTTPPVPLLAHYPLPGSGLYPESVTFDPVGRHFYVGSLSEGSVIRVAADGATTYLFEGTGEAKRATLGLDVDAANRRLAVCAYLDVEVPTGRIWLFDLSTGTRSHDIDLSAIVPNGSCNDVHFDSAGALYVTDRELPNVYKINNLDTNPSATLFVTDPSLDKVLIGQNGLALTPDGRYLLTGHYLPPKFFRIALPNAPTDSPQVQTIPLTGTHPFSQLFSGADGITFFGGSLYVAFGSSLVKVDPIDTSWSTASYVALDAGRTIAALAIAEGQLYVLESDVAAFVLSGAPPKNFAIVRIDPSTLSPTR